MKVASWNVNSVRVRLPQILEWLNQTSPDVLALQETKVTDDKFPEEAFKEINYHAKFSGQPSYNGVALLSKSSPQDICTQADGISLNEKRVIAATINSIRVINFYVVNGREVGSDFYQKKMAWLEGAKQFIQSEISKHKDIVVVGDFNIAPEDIDVHDPIKWKEKILCSTQERAKLKEILALGFVDTFRDKCPDKAEYSWWDHRGACFQRGHGLRIDLVLASHNLNKKCIKAEIDQAPRGWERPSDHTPVLAEFKV